MLDDDSSASHLEHNPTVLRSTKPCTETPPWRRIAPTQQRPSSVSRGTPTTQPSLQQRTAPPKRRTQNSRPQASFPESEAIPTSGNRMKDDLWNSKEMVRRALISHSDDERCPLLEGENQIEETRSFLRMITVPASSFTTTCILACLFTSSVLVGIFSALINGMSDTHRVEESLSSLSLLKPFASHQGHGLGGDAKHFHNLAPPGAPGFPYFSTYKGKSLNVSYDGRSVIINGDRVLLFGGSMHPARATRQTWDMALDQAVQQGLNLVTIYVIWAKHQPMQDSPLDWTLQRNVTCSHSVSIDDEDAGADVDRPVRRECDWDLAQAIQSAADRGLFVHIRVGPYVCAEYSYGGIPEWLAVPGMALRRPNRLWMKAMEDFVRAITTYLVDHRLFAYQGGPIILAQIENELGGDVDASTENLVQVDEHGNLVDHDDTVLDSSVKNARSLRKATLQDYADWCGRLAEQLVPNVVWTMCNGLSANNTIETYNGFLYETEWVDDHGGSGRIQVDQPALWTEDEGGFQVWGEEPTLPSDYVWGASARSMAYTALRWFARGGTHLNFYMWWGGYNRGRSAAAGITNMYASDAPMCPSGQRREPKFSHFQSMLRVIKSVAPVLLKSQSALGQQYRLRTRANDGTWEMGNEQWGFLYQQASGDDTRRVLFVENACNTTKTILVPLPAGKKAVEVVEYSSILFIDDSLAFDSATVQPEAMAFTRQFEYHPVRLVNWSTDDERVGPPQSSDSCTRQAPRPIEQTVLNIESNVYSDYAWYETDFHLPSDCNESTTLFIETQEANAFVVYVDGIYVGSNDTHNHLECNVTLSLSLGPLGLGRHKLSLLSESLGYSNLVGRWGASTQAKKKGIVGAVLLFSTSTGNVSLCDGHTWKSFAGLHGETRPTSGPEMVDGSLRNHSLSDGYSNTSIQGRWFSAFFETPSYDPAKKALFLDITRGRGHLWLNRIDLGRYWNITRGDNDEYSQRYYFLPHDYLYSDGKQNQLILFDAFGNNHKDSMRILYSWVESSTVDSFQDEVDYPMACI